MGYELDMRYGTMRSEVWDGRVLEPEQVEQLELPFLPMEDKCLTSQKP